MNKFRTIIELSRTVASLEEIIQSLVESIKEDASNLLQTEVRGVHPYYTNHEGFQNIMVKITVPLHFGVVKGETHKPSLDPEIIKKIEESYDLEFAHLYESINGKHVIFASKFNVG
jgi:hypothetical protein